MKWNYIILAFAGLFFLGLIDNGRSALYPEILKHLNISTSYGSHMFVLASLAGLLTNLISPFWLPRIGALAGHRLFLLIQAIGCFGIGASADLPMSYPFLLFFSMVFGITLGGMGVTANIIISKSGPAQFRRKTLAGLHAMYGIASLAVPLIVVFFYSIGLNWSSSFKLLSFFPLLAFILSLRIKESETINTSKKRARSTTAKSIRITTGLIFACYVSAEIAISSRLVLYLTETVQWDNDKSCGYLSLFFALLLTGRVFFSIFHFPLKSIQCLILSLTFTLIASLIGLYIHPLGLAFCGLTMSFFFPCAMDWLNETFPGDIDYMISSVLASMGIGLVSMHWVFGLMADNWGTANALKIVPVLVTVSLLITAAYLFTTFPARKKTT